jgi:hypothetical protein
MKVCAPKRLRKKTAGPRPRVGSRMTENLSFFDIAAGLIPVLLLGGAVADRVRSAAPTDPRSIPDSAGRMVAFSLASIFGLYAGFAEVLAISSALSDEYSTLSAWVVALAVTFGTWGLAGVVVWPWVAPLFRPRLPPGEVLPASVRRARGLLLVSLLGVVIMSGVLLRTAIQSEATNPLPAALAQVILQNIDAEDELLDARVAAARKPKSPVRQLRLANAKARADITQRLVDQRAEKIADVLD